MSKAKDKAKSYLSDSQKIVGTSLGQYIKSQDNLTDEFVNDFLSYLKFVGWNDLAKWIKIIFSNITTSIEGPDISHISGNDNKTRVINAIIDRYNFTKRQMCKKLKKSGGLIHKDHNC